MNINVIRLRSPLHEANKEMIDENTNFLEEINNELMNDDITLVENDPKASYSIVFVESGGSEPYFVEALPTLKEPIVLLSNGKNNSLPAALEIKSYCGQKGLISLLFTGEESQIAEAIKDTSTVINAYNSLNGTTLGVVGKPSDWLIASQVDYQLVKEKFNINLVDISMDEFKEEINKHELVEIPHYHKLQAKFKNQDTLNLALEIYSALKRLIDKYHLSGLTVRCFDLLGEYQNTSCLAFALLNEEGITATCEGDVPSMLTMHLLRALTGMPSFQANPSTVDFKNNTILFAHCTLPINMCNKYELTTHFESGLGIGVKGEMPLGKVTICKLCPDLKAEHAVCFNGTIKENLSLKNYCRTQILVEPDENGIISLFKDDFGNHMIITYADCLSSYYTLLNLYEKKYDKSKEEEKK